VPMDQSPFRTFVGIGFGPIQSGLFLYEAFRSSNFDRLVVAEVACDVVQAVRQAGGKYRINIAERGRVSVQSVTGLDIFNPNDATDQTRLIAAIAESAEIATALPAVEFFDRGEPSPASLLAAGLMQRRKGSPSNRTLIYAGENNIRAAEVLSDSVRAHIAPECRAWFDEHVQFVNTVIGKMSGVVDSSGKIPSANLQSMVESGTRAILVEEFNHILIERIRLPNFERGLNVFEEKDDLLPFEEAKLYGHNAAHALMGYLAHRRGYQFMSEVRDTELMELVGQALIEESGIALCRRHEHIDPLFSAKGWHTYATDLLDRMINPHLRDQVARVVRDPARKLGWNDRLIGTMRLALTNAVEPELYAKGAAAALAMLVESQPGDPARALEKCWSSDDGRREERETISSLVIKAYRER
jgi:mannitol-1-phosphate 5-dehydrogenase